MSLIYGVKEIFDTLQGEGSRAGARSVFLRFTGCNLWSGLETTRQNGLGECAQWCDTDFSSRGSKKMTALDILTELNGLWPEKEGADEARWVVLTGGEPMLQVDLELVNTLEMGDWHIAIETNGTQDRRELVFDHVCVSPKLLRADHDKRAIIHPSWEGNVDELKVVLPGGLDNGWTDRELVEIAERIEPRYKFVAPMDMLVSVGLGDTILHQLHARTRRGDSLDVDTDRAISKFDGNVKRCIDFVKRHPTWRVSSQQHKLWNVR